MRIMMTIPGMCIRANMISSKFRLSRCQMEVLGKELKIIVNGFATLLYLTNKNDRLVLSALALFASVISIECAHRSSHFLILLNVISGRTRRRDCLCL